MLFSQVIHQYHIGFPERGAILFELMLGQRLDMLPVSIEIAGFEDQQIILTDGMYTPGITTLFKYHLIGRLNLNVVITFFAYNFILQSFIAEILMPVRLQIKDRLTEVRKVHLVR